jgi:glycosyltransferase involved in cell wall biosynthesis
VKVDVVLPFHKVDSYLWEAVNSVLASKNVEVRLIMMDDRVENIRSIDVPRSIGSGSAAIEIHKTAGQGYASALNESKKYLKAEWTGLMNSDDLISQNRFSLQIEKITESETDLSICALQKFGSKGRIPSMAGVIDPKIFDYRFLLLGAYGADATWVARTSIFQAINFPELTLGSDWCAAMENFPGLKVSGISESLYFYRMHSDQVTAEKTNLPLEIEPIFQRWAYLSKKLNLPIVSKEAFINISMPWLTSRISKAVEKEVLNWFREFEKQFTNKQQLKFSKRLIKRRKVIMEFKIKKITISMPITKSQMLLEIVCLKVKGNKPRNRKLQHVELENED